MQPIGSQHWNKNALYSIVWWTFSNLNAFNATYIVPTAAVTQACKDSESPKAFHKDPASYFVILSKKNKRTQYKGIRGGGIGIQFKTDNNFTKSDFLLGKDWESKRT